MFGGVAFLQGGFFFPAGNFINLEESYLIITVDKNYYAVPKSKLLGNCGETMSREIKVIYPDVADATVYKLRFLLPDNTTCYEADVSEGSMTVGGSLLTQTGEVECQWLAIGFDGNDTATFIAKSNVMTLVVGESIESDETKPVPTYEQASELFDEALAVQQEIMEIKPELDEMHKAFGGFSFVKCTESEYNALSEKDSNTLYYVLFDNGGVGHYMGDIDIYEGIGDLEAALDRVNGEVV